MKNKIEIDGIELKAVKVNNFTYENYCKGCYLYYQGIECVEIPCWCVEIPCRSNNNHFIFKEIKKFKKTYFRSLYWTNKANNIATSILKKRIKNNSIKLDKFINDLKWQ